MIRIWLNLNFVTILFVMIELFVIRKNLIMNYPLVRRLAAASLMKCRDKVKHKKVNDLSGVFSYQD